MAQAKRSPQQSRTQATRKKKPRGRAATQVQPRLLYALLLTAAIAAGILAIRTIHATTPALTGFEARQLNEQDGDGGERLTTLPAAVDLMKTQGWITPATIEVVDRQLPRDELPPEIAAVSEVLIDTEVVRPSGDGYLPPPPIDANGAILAGPQPGQTDFAMPQLRDDGLTPSGDAVIVQGNEMMPGQGPGSTPGNDQIGSMIAGIDRASRDRQAAPPAQPDQATATPRPAQPPAPEQALSLAQVQEAECGRLGFISRIACQDRVKTRYCKGRIGQVPGCNRDSLKDTGDF